MKKDFTFIDRKKGYDKLLIILSGYKPDIWDKVFERLYKYIPGNIDVCIVTSGLQNKRLMNIAKEQNWSYLSTELNNLCYAQNVCISSHPDAQIIYKMDEDIFLTKDVFQKMLDTYETLLKYSEYVPSAIVPMMNVNCTTYIEVLRRSCRLHDFQTKFGKAKITNGLHHNQHILENPEVAKYLWTAIDIDEEDILSKIIDAVPCATRFSIGFVMFPRSTWSDMNGFPVLLNSTKDYERTGMGIDEKELCKFAMLKAKPIMIDRRCLVGHLGYGPQTKDMLQFFKDYPEHF